MKEELVNSIEPLSQGLSWVLSPFSKLTTAHFIASGTIATATASVAASNDVWKVTAFLAVGSSMGVLWSYLSMENMESRRKTAARVIIGALGGIAIPRLIDLGLDRWLKFTLGHVDPGVVMLMGFAFAVLSFYVLHTYFRGAELRQKEMSKALGKSIGNVATSIVEKQIGAQLPETKDERRETDRENPSDRG